MRTYLSLLFVLISSVPARADVTTETVDAVYELPQTKEGLGEKPVIPLRATIQRDGASLSVTYVIPLRLTGGTLNRIHLEGQPVNADGRFEMAGQLVSTSACDTSSTEIVCNTNYVGNQLGFGTIDAGLAADHVSLADYPRLTQWARVFRDEPRGVIRMKIPLFMVII